MIDWFRKATQKALIAPEAQLLLTEVGPLEITLIQLIGIPVVHASRILLYLENIEVVVFVIVGRG